MKKVSSTEFTSDYGFSSPNFRVDIDGNITATSISLLTDTDLPADRSFEEVDGNFRIENNSNDNPTFTVFRTRTTTIDLDLDNLTFNIFTDTDFSTFFSIGLTHDSGDSSDDAQGKQIGRLAWNVPLSAPNTLYYSNNDGSVFGIINVQNTPSVFSEVDITETTASTDPTTGALTVAGGVGIEGDLNLGGELNLQGIGIPALTSETNLELEAGNAIIVRIDDVLLGEINSSGSEIPINNTTIENTAIGTNSPSSAAFTSATVTNTAISTNDITNKNYVDTTAIALAITFGI